ncbi:hypothetical protein BDV12DRAFT_210187 [Aspergillus spectabilis]
MPPPPTQKQTSTTTLLRLANYTLFTFLSIILLCLILLTPADAIYQCYVTHRLTNIFIITGGYVFTFLLAVLIYATRIYTNRTVLGGIPKAWIPVEREDVGKSVRRLVVEGLGRSALVAGGVRPRDLKWGERGVGRDGEGGIGESEEGKGLLRGFDFEVNPRNPPWGVIEHAGWSAPGGDADAGEGGGGGGGRGDAHLPPGLCYRAVIRELPHLIEAKAVSLAPPDPYFTVPSEFQAHPQTQNLNQNQQHPDLEAEDKLPDTRIVEILRRPAHSSLRQYVTHLSDLSILNPPETALDFLSLYERARFSGQDLRESEFHELMRIFADLLRGMQFDLHEYNSHLIGLDLELGMDGGSMRDTNSIFGSQNSESVIGPSDEEGETETDGGTLGSRSRSSRYRYHFANEYLDGPGTGTASNYRDSGDRGRRGGGRGVPSQWPRTPSASASVSTHSLRPVRSNVSNSVRSFGSGSGYNSGGSVIRLADARTESGLGVPYVLGPGPNP